MSLNQNFGVIMYFQGSLKALFWAKGVGLADVINEVTMSPDGEIIACFTMGDSFLFFDRNGILLNALRHPTLTTFSSKDISTMLVSSEYQVFVQQRLYLDAGYLMNFMTFPYDLSSAQGYTVDAEY